MCFKTIEPYSLLQEIYYSSQKEAQDCLEKMMQEMKIKNKKKIDENMDKKIQDMDKKIQELELMINKIYFGPNMPGYYESKQDFMSSHGTLVG